MNYMVVGGAGFIGSHVTKRLMREEPEAEVYVYDNFSSGSEEHFEEILNDKRLHIIQGDLKDLEQITKAMECIDVVYSVASNPDIAKAISQPDIAGFGISIIRTKAPPRNTL